MNNKISRKVKEKRFRRRLKSKKKKALKRKNIALQLYIKNLYGISPKSTYFDREPEAPPNFSFSSNENGVLKYIGLLEKYLNEGKTVFVKLNHILNIDQEAVILLLGIMAEFKSANIEFNGNFPLSLNAKKILINSGFLKQLYPHNQQFSFGSKQGIYTHGNKIYDEMSCSEALSDALICVFGERRRSQGARRVLLEAMKNTIAHASPNSNKRHWWLSFNRDEKNNKLIVSMLDYGVGIFESLSTESDENPGFTWYQKTFSLGFTNPTILKKIMDGELVGISRTRKSKHGTGLPGMKSALQNQFISKLVIVSNDVYADVSENIYRHLNAKFNGTLVQFEICHKCKSFPYE